MNAASAARLAEQTASDLSAASRSAEELAQFLTRTLIVPDTCAWSVREAHRCAARLTDALTRIAERDLSVLHPAFETAVQDAQQRTEQISVLVPGDSQSIVSRLLPGEQLNVFRTRFTAHELAGALAGASTVATDFALLFSDLATGRARTARVVAPAVQAQDRLVFSEQLAATPAGRLSSVMVGIAVRVLPAAHRPRFSAEFLSELAELPSPARFGYAVRQLLHSWTLRVALSADPDPYPDDSPHTCEAPL